MRFFENCVHKDETKILYLKLAKCFHPDKGGDAELMKELNKQYEVWEYDVFKYQPTNLSKNQYNLEFEKQIKKLSIEKDMLAEENKRLAFDVNLYKYKLDCQTQIADNYLKNNLELNDKLDIYKNMSLWERIVDWWKNK